ncbi:MAG: di-trans,poly-cis-decaprenylcistransferase, partial [Verrucomicrobia bacterium]|nr:di-trans,poly-cis-decaprenylcistransferase [Verrucomicrobiota bacterium]
QALAWSQGHIAGAEAIVTIVEAAMALGIKVLTIFGFSTENLQKRSKMEVDHLTKIIAEYLEKYREKLLHNGIRLRAIGNLEALPPFLRYGVEKTAERTAHCSNFELVLALNYGGRDEICRAIKRMAVDLVDKKISPDTICEESLRPYLDTGDLPDPDLLIRTSGEKRISNFLLWQSSYSEVFIDDVTWPEFTPHHLLGAVCDFQQRDRRKGGGEAST